MRIIVRVLVAVTSSLTVLAPTVTAHASGEAEDTAYVEQLLFDTSLADFIAIADDRIGPDGHAGDTSLDWSTDYCSAPLVGSTGRSFDFSAACRRHDFGYRNVDPDHRTRKRIDQQLLADMKQHCRRRWPPDRPTCYSWAYAFYGAVRVAGGP